MNDGPRGVRGRALQLLNVIAYAGGVLVIVAVVNFFAQQPWLRRQIDATKTRAYSLSDQSVNLLRSLSGEWTIALVMVEEGADRAVGRQVDEVLRRFQEESDAISVVRIDPTDPRSLREYERLLGQLMDIYGDLVQAFDVALDDGSAAFGELRIFAQQHSAGLLKVAEQLPEDFVGREGLQRRAQLMVVLSQQGDKVLAEIDKSRRIDQSQPIPDYDVARSILAEALSQWSNEMFDVSRLLDQLLDDPNTDVRLRRFVTKAVPRYEELSRRLSVAADPLLRLPPLELSEIGRHVHQGETALVLGPGGAAVIPSSQLFPTNVKSVAASSVTFDQRFRGEQLIASTIRSLVHGRMPMVVFTHARRKSLLRKRDGNIDLMGLGTMLQASRFDVREWMVPTAQPPAPAEGQEVVWVVVPPPSRKGVAPDGDEQTLIRAVSTLIAEGEPVLLSMNPSLLPSFRRSDPWATVPEPFGLSVDTGRVVVEAQRVSEEDFEVEFGQTLTNYQGGGAIARAVQGRQSFFDLPLPIRSDVSTESVVRHEVIARVEPDGRRWLEDRWSERRDLIKPPPDDQRLEEPVALVMAAERADPVSGANQRLIVVGSGGWMLSRAADVAINVGGDRYALLYPGNFELMLSSVLWLAGMDELIAPSPASQEIARLGELSTAARRSWFWVCLVLLPGSCLGTGLVVWVRRKT